jgi:hypothetical protein
MIAARLSPGAISESTSSHLPPSVVSKTAKPVMFPPGWLSRETRPLRAFSARGLISLNWKLGCGVYCHLYCQRLWRKRALGFCRRWLRTDPLGAITAVQFPVGC